MIGIIIVVVMLLYSWIKNGSPGQQAFGIIVVISALILVGVVSSGGSGGTALAIILGLLLLAGMIWLVIKLNGEKEHSGSNADEASEAEHGIKGHLKQSTASSNTNLKAMPSMKQTPKPDAIAQAKRELEQLEKEINTLESRLERQQSLLHQQKAEAGIPEEERTETIPGVRIV